MKAYFGKNKNKKKLSVVLVSILLLGGGVTYGVAQNKTHEIGINHNFAGNDTSPVDLPKKSPLEQMLDFIRGSLDSGSKQSKTA